MIETQFPPDGLSFTVEYDGTSNVLKSFAHISQHFKSPAQVEKQGISGLKKYTAIWDTGATNTVITNKVVKDCGLKPITMAKVHTASGTELANVYIIGIILPNKVILPRIRATEGKLVGADALIGMDIIGRGDFAVTNFKGKTTMSFRLPSSEKIDFVKQGGPKPLKRGTPKVGRNDPCPCGSGKKYKRCHGR